MLMSSFSSMDDEDQFGAAAQAEPAAALAPSAELRELCHIQLSMLITSLESRIGAMVTETGCSVRCAVYRRSPASLPSGQLQLQLVAASDAREADTASGFSGVRQDLILGIPGTNEQFQEAWIVEQNLIVLPDSGGLVLPLAHNSFLVGLLIVECCAPTTTTTGGGRESDFTLRNVAGALHPPASAVFSPADMALIKQTGTSLGLACALDLRAALERAGHAVRRRQVQGLVQQARKPLRTLRTLGAMLAPRLQEGEPERDMAESISAQGQRLGDIVSQLQVFLSPAMPVVSIGRKPEMSSSGGNLSSSDGILSSSPFSPSNNNNSSSAAAAAASETDRNAIISSQPALPSSSIGGDYWGGSNSNSSSAGSSNRRKTGTDAESACGYQTPERSFSIASMTTSTDSGEIDIKEEEEKLSSSSSSSNSSSTGQRQLLQQLPTALLLATLAPLLRSAENFASVSGVTFLLRADQLQNQQQQQQPIDTTTTTTANNQTSSSSSPAQVAISRCARRLQINEVCVCAEPIALKRMLSQLLDGAIACGARGDCIELVVDAEEWQGRPGVVVATRLMQAIGPATLRRGPATAVDADGHIYLAEFATLSRLARQTGGWFDVSLVESTPSSSSSSTDFSSDFVNSSSSASDSVFSMDDVAGGGGGGGILMAALWLPTSSSSSSSAMNSFEQLNYII